MICGPKANNLYFKKHGELGAWMKFSGLLIALSSLAMLACTTAENYEWIPVGGSKVAGTVILGIDVPPKMGIRETEVHADTAAANALADKRCRNWGYAGAETFDRLPIQTVCYAQGISPCWSKSLRVNYSCVEKK